ncbi:hypothetical protein FACS1894137_11710 [Spirochaetia bacterium]|nr:hypothetical protein FACS1894137_11710 [Spirochaetia bacterium]
MRRFSKIFLIPVLILIAVCYGVSSCAGFRKITSTEYTSIEPIEKDPKETPAWKNTPPKEDKENKYFVGVSRRFSTVADARDAAADNARRQVLDYYGQYIKNNGVEKSGFSGLSSDTINASIDSEREIRDYAELIIQQLQRENYYTETYLDKDGQASFEAYVLCTLPRKVAEEHFREFEQKISDQYSSLLKQNTVLDTLSSYGTVYKALENNLIHRAVARLDDGKTSLYQHVLNQPNIIAHSISFPHIQNMQVQKTDTLELVLRANSTLINNIGALDCTIRVEGPNNLRVKDIIKKNGDNSYTLTKHTQTLAPGRYTLTYELPLKDLSPLIAKNPGDSFSFTVTPVTATVEFIGEIEEGHKEKIFKAFQTGLKPYEITLLEEGKETPIPQLQNKYTFTVNVSQSEPYQYRKTNRTAFDLTAIINFTRNGETIVVFNPPLTTSELSTNKANAFASIAEKVTENTTFFESVNKTIGL